MNQIQFQPGLSLSQFMRAFGTEASCEEAVKRARWPRGFVCPRCGASAHYVVGHGARKLFQCNACQHQTSLAAGTLFANTKLPLTSLSGALHAFNFRKYAASYLAAFAYRFNRHFDLPGLFAPLAVDATQCKPRTERAIRGKARYPSAGS